MSSPASLTCHCMSPLKSLWKIRRACLNSLVLGCCDLWSATLLSARFQVSWENQDACASVGPGVLGTPPLRTAKANHPSLWGRIVFGRIGQRVRPRW